MSQVYDRPLPLKFQRKPTGNVCDICGKRRGQGKNQTRIDHTACSAERKRRGFAIGRDLRA